MGKKCFFITPIGAEGSEQRKLTDSVFDHIVEPACKQKGYEAIRADRIADSGQINNTIIEHVIMSDLVIADLTGHNPNVFYELAIRHSYRKPAIQIICGKIDIPFDVANMRTISYENSIEGPTKAIEQICKLIDSIESGAKVSNPVSDVSTILDLATPTSEDNSETLTALLLEVQRIPENLNTLEKNIETRFSQMLSAFVQSLSTNVQSASPQDRMLEVFMSKLLESPESGENAMNSLLKLQKMIETQEKDK